MHIVNGLHFASFRSFLLLKHVSLVWLLLQLDKLISGEPEAQGPTLQTAKALAMTAIDVLLDQSLVKKMKEDFVEEHEKRK